MKKLLFILLLGLGFSQTELTTRLYEIHGYSDGEAHLTISGGIQPYNTNWFGQNHLALPAGNHNFEIIDSNNCIHQGIATIYQPSDITTNEITSDVLCNGDSNGTRSWLFG